jgi:hypothetical protein
VWYPPVLIFSLLDHPCRRRKSFRCAPTGFNSFGILLSRLRASSTSIPNKRFHTARILPTSSGSFSARNRLSTGLSCAAGRLHGFADRLTPRLFVAAGHRPINPGGYRQRSFDYFGLLFFRSHFPASPLSPRFLMSDVSEGQARCGFAPDFLCVRRPPFGRFEKVVLTAI